VPHDLSRLPFATSIIGTAVDGEPIIVLPGGPCRGPEYLGDLAGLGDEHPLIVLHPRGTPRTGGRSRGWWTDADDVALLSDALGLDSFSILAHSAGTRLALATAARYGARVRSMVLVTPPATWLTNTESDAPALAAAHTDPLVQRAFHSLMADDASTETEFAEAFQQQAPASYARWTETERAHARVGDVSLAAATAWFEGIPADAADRIRDMPDRPSLVVGGDRDLLTGVQPVRDYARALGAELTMLVDCGHYPWVEQPRQFRTAVSDWWHATFRG